MRVPLLADIPLQKSMSRFMLLQEGRKRYPAAAHRPFLLYLNRLLRTDSTAATEKGHGVSYIHKVAYCTALSEIVRKCRTTVFAAIAKGHGKGKLLSVLGVQKIKKICTELEDSKSFKCKRVWGTGASGEVRA